MGNSVIKDELHKQIEEGDEKLLQMIYAVIREYNGVEFSEAEISALEKRKENREKGISKTHSWKTAKAMITGKVSSGK